MKELFIPKRFNRVNAALIAHANEIIEEYMKDGFTLTLRQLYYQFVTRDLIPNKQESYNRIGETISAARLAGEIDWDAIEDRSRNHKPNDGTFDSPEDILKTAWKGYRIPFWSTQPNHVEVWVEKEALSGVLDSVCRKLDNDVPIKIHRIALNFDQIQKYNPPPNPAKTTDCRFESYRKKYGTESWELDALEPRLIQGLIAEEIESLLDKAEWQKKQTQEDEEKDTLKYIYENFDEIDQMKNKAGQAGN